MTCGGYSRPMTDPTRGARIRRGARRPGWILMSVLLVLAIAASSALVFTNRVELLKLAVILSLWAAVVAAFVSVIYRRQSDSDQAKVRDLKLVYDLQLDREISARREYELAVETQLRRELASELRAQSADEVSALRAELAALRANLEYLFDTDLSHRHAIETDRRGGDSRELGGWTPGADTAGRVRSSRIDTEDLDEVSDAESHAPDTEESPIIDVPAEPHPPEGERPSAADEAGGAHRRFSEGARAGTYRADETAGRQWEAPPAPPPRNAPPSPEPQFPWLPPPARPAPPPPPPPPQPAPPPPPPPPRAPAPAAPAAAQWQPAPPQGQWMPGGDRAAPPGGNGGPAEYVGRRRADDAPAEPPRGRHYAEATESTEATEATAAAPEPEQHEDDDSAGGAHTGGQSVAELLARLQAAPSGGGRRRRRED
ncbi:hypothetical protein GCM10027535_14020 [Mycolicibacterium hippocampi]|uniref:DUF6779 domain-containing protein n=2 Tax=Mycolicibacterium hippocampi TaxID=659824 RepID=A0A7I9ZXE1_9MYCO|nr:hypothetical protein MHIP_59360 [Mycolicibacterium hippocampi]